MLATWIQVFELLHLGIMCMAKLRLNRTFVDPGVWFHVLKLLGLWWRQSATKQTLPSLSLNGFDAVVAGWGSLEVSFYFFWVSRFYLACQPHGVAIWTDEGWTTKLALKFDRRPATPRIKRTPQARRKRALAKSAQKPAGKARPRGKATKSAGATKHEDKACKPCLRPGQFIFAWADLEKAAASSRQPRAILHSDLCFWRGRFIGGAKGANSSLSPANIYKKNRAWQVCWTFMSPWSWRASCQHLGKFLVRTEHVCRVKLTQTQTRAQTDGCIFKGVVPAFGQNTR